VPVFLVLSNTESNKCILKHVLYVRTLAPSLLFMFGVFCFFFYVKFYLNNILMLNGYLIMLGGYLVSLNRRTCIRALRSTAMVTVLLVLSHTRGDA
jgi:hypothetical protein